MKPLYLIGLLLGTCVLTSAATAASISSPYDSNVSSSLVGFLEDSHNTSSNVLLNFGDNSYGATTEITGENAWEIKSESFLNGISMNADPFSAATSSASFDQYFRATSSGEARIRFEWDGTLETNGLTSVGYLFSAQKSGGDSIFGDEELNSGVDESALISGDEELIFEVSEGEVFLIHVALDTWVNEIFEEEGSIFGRANFLNTAALTGFSDNLQTVSAVPVPAALWLLGSAITFLGMNRRKK